MVKMLGRKGLKNPILLVINRSFTNFPDAEECAESLRSMGLEIVVMKKEE